MLDFLRIHPNLEKMTIHYQHLELEEGGVPFYVPNFLWQLLKLKMLTCFSLTITKGICLNRVSITMKLWFIYFSFIEMVDDFVEFYPHLKTLHLGNLSLTMTDGSTDEKFQIDEECLAGLRFKRLTSISLSGFHLNGSFLIPV